MISAETKFSLLQFIDLIRDCPLNLVRFRAKPNISKTEQQLIFQLFNFLVHFMKLKQNRTIDNTFLIATCTDQPNPLT